MTGLKTGFWLRVLNIEVTFVPNFKLSQKKKKTQPENKCDIVFQKVKGRGRTVKRASVYVEAALRRVL